MWPLQATQNNVCHGKIICWTSHLDLLEGNIPPGLRNQIFSSISIIQNNFWFFTKFVFRVFDQVYSGSRDKIPPLLRSQGGLLWGCGLILGYKMYKNTLFGGENVLYKKLNFTELKSKLVSAGFNWNLNCNISICIPTHTGGNSTRMIEHFLLVCLCTSSSKRISSIGSDQNFSMHLNVFLKMNWYIYKGNSWENVVSHVG